MEVREASAEYLAQLAPKVPKGYKQTEVGVIPEDWETNMIGNSMQLINGRAFKPEDWKSHGLPIIRIQNLNDTGASFNYYSGPVEERHLVKTGDLLFAWSGTTGTSFGARVWNGPSGVLNQHIFRVIPNQKYLTTGYALLVLRNVQDAIEKQSHGFKASFVHVKKSDLICVLLPLPQTKVEQDSIFTALSDVDTLLAKLDQLITKKRDLKQAAMQHLLAGQIRLPGFSGEWKVTRLREIGDFLKGRGITRDQAQSGPIPCIRYGEIYTTHNDYIRKFQSWISAEVAAAATRLKCGDILFAGSGETKEEIGKCVAFVDVQEAYAGGDIVILRPHAVDSLFLGYGLNTTQVNQQKASRGQGDAVVHISATALAEVTLLLPERTEQTAIAAVLSDMDAEIVALEARRDKTRMLKQGMMQELLTGRIRLV